MADALPVRQYVVDALRAEILAQRLTPGEKLVERRLCEMTGASRTALREGLRQLEAEGLIEIIPNRGPIVPKLTPKHAQDIYQLRGVLEADLSRQAAQSATGHDVIELRAIAKEVTSAMRSGDRMSLLAAKTDFYGWLMRLSGNDETNVVMRKLLGRTAIIWPSTVFEDMPTNAHSIRIFTDLVDAIAAHDPDRAAQAARVQVQSAGEFVVAYMDRAGKCNTK